MRTAISVNPPDLAPLPITVQMKPLEAGTDQKERDDKGRETSFLAYFHH